MEIEIPFSDKKISSELASEDLKYRAILSRDSLFYGLFDPKNQLVHSDVISVDEIPKSSKLKKLEHFFDDSRIAFNNSIFTLCLTTSANEINPFSLLSFTQSLGEEKNYHTQNDKIDLEDDSSLYYAIPKPIHKSVIKHVDQCQINHYHSVFLNSLSFNQGEKSIAISLISGNMNLAYHSGERLELSNCYQVRNESDFYYYIALIFDQYSLKKGSVSIKLDGDLSQIKYDRQRFFEIFGSEPSINGSGSETNETNSMLYSLIRLNECA